MVFQARSMLGENTATPWDVLVLNINVQTHHDDARGSGVWGNSVRAGRRQHHKETSFLARREQFQAGVFR